MDATTFSVILSSVVSAAMLPAAFAFGGLLCVAGLAYWMAA